MWTPHDAGIRIIIHTSAVGTQESAVNLARKNPVATTATNRDTFQSADAGGSNCLAGAQVCLLSFQVLQMLCSKPAACL